MPRTITSHQVDGLNPELQIEVLDEPGPGGACSAYKIHLGESETEIKFHTGPLSEKAEGVTSEALIAILIDRLTGFQAGPLACKENEVALTHLQHALWTLHKRTRDRVQRKVSGTPLK